MVEQDAAPALRASQARTRAAPGPRLAANKGRPPGAGWRTAVHTLERPTKSTARCRKENARKSARTARACPGGAPSGAPVFSRGTRAHKTNGCVTWRATPSIFWGARETRRETGLPRASTKNTGDFVRLFTRTGRPARVAVWQV